MFTLIAGSVQLNPNAALSKQDQSTKSTPTEGRTEGTNYSTQEITNSYSGTGLTGTSAHSISEAAITFLIITGSSSGNTRSVVQGHTARMLVFDTGQILRALQTHTHSQEIFHLHHSDPG